MLKIPFSIFLSLLLFYPNYVQMLEESSAHSSSVSSKPTDITSVLNQFLPEPLLSITIGQTSKKHLLHIIGTPAKKDNDQNYFYNLSGKNYDTTIGVKNNKVHYVLYSPPSGSLLLRELKPYIEPSLIHQAYQQKHHTTESHSSGRTFDISLPKKQIKITVRNNPQESIQSLLFLK